MRECRAVRERYRPSGGWYASLGTRYSVLPTGCGSSTSVHDAPRLHDMLQLLGESLHQRRPAVVLRGRVLIQRDARGAIVRDRDWTLDRVAIRHEGRAV